MNKTEGELRKAAFSLADSYIERVMTDDYVVRQCTFDDVWEDFIDWITDEIGKPYDIDYEGVYEDQSLSAACFEAARYIIVKYVRKLESLTGEKYKMPYDINPEEYE